MSKLKLNQRVKFVDKGFLSNGYIKKIVKSFRWSCYIVKLDEKAPSEYAWDTDEVMAFPSDIEAE